MEVIHEYDSETQKLIDEIERTIVSIRQEYESKLHPKTAKECVKLSRPGYEKAIIKEYNKRIKPYQKRLEEIYLTSVPKIIIKGHMEKNI